MCPSSQLPSQRHILMPYLYPRSPLPVTLHVCPFQWYSVFPHLRVTFHVVHPSCVQFGASVLVYGIVSSACRPFQPIHSICRNTIIYGQGALKTNVINTSARRTKAQIHYFREPEDGGSSTKEAFQFPPHHRRMRSPPHSWYSSFVTAYRQVSLRREQVAIPRHASKTGFFAWRTFRAISGGRIGRRTLCRRGMSSGSWDGAPVTKTF